MTFPTRAPMLKLISRSFESNQNYFSVRRNIFESISSRKNVSKNVSKSGCKTEPWNCGVSLYFVHFKYESLNCTKIRSRLWLVQFPFVINDFTVFNIFLLDRTDSSSRCLPSFSRMLTSARSTAAMYLGYS